MPVQRIDHADDPRVADYIGVKDPALVKQRGLFIAESRLVVRRLFDSGRYRVRSLLLHDASAAGLDDLITAAGDTVEVFVAPIDVIRAVSGFNLHRGCLALAERPVDRTMEEVLAASGFLVVVERLADADNVGLVFRSAEALGVDAVLLSPGTCDPYYRKAVRTSAGATLQLPFAAAAPWPEAIARLRREGFVVAALTPAPDAIAIGDFVAGLIPGGKVALLLGTEGLGLTPEAFALSDVRVRIPMTGAVDSLNVGTAAAIAMHRVYERRAAAASR